MRGGGGGGGGFFFLIGDDEGEEEVEEGVGRDAGEPPLERFEQRQLHVPDCRWPERVRHHLFHLHACIAFM